MLLSWDGVGQGHCYGSGSRALLWSESRELLWEWVKGIAMGICHGFAWHRNWSRSLSWCQVMGGKLREFLQSCAAVMGVGQVHFHGRGPGTLSW
jgi:hypothetical protein